MVVHIKHYVALEIVLFSRDESLWGRFLKMLVETWSRRARGDSKGRNKQGRLKWYRFEQSQHCEFAFFLLLLRLFNGDALLIRVLKILNLRPSRFKHTLELIIQLPQLDKSSVGSEGETGCLKSRLSVLLLAN